MDEKEIKIEALRRYCQDVINGLPFKWVDKAMEMMLNEQQPEETEKLKRLINYVYEQSQRAEAEKIFSRIEKMTFPLGKHNIEEIKQEFMPEKKEEKK